MSIAALSRQVTNTCMCHISGDEYRSSDHDPVIIDQELSGERVYLAVVM
jgi:predicted extracellular nuclease